MQALFSVSPSSPYCEGLGPWRTTDHELLAIIFGSEWNTLKATKRIRTVLYADQRLSPAELEILHTPAMQRLYGLRQLGFADRVFLDASHSRLHHVVGVLHHIDKLVSAISGNLERSEHTLAFGADSATELTARGMARLVKKRRPVVRLIGLLHDLTHAPFGHTVEDEIQLVEIKHDDPARQSDAFYRLICQLISWLDVEVHGAAPRPSSASTEPLRRVLSHDSSAPLPDPSVIGGIARDLIARVDRNTAALCWRLTPRDLAELLAQLQCAMNALLHLEALHTRQLQPKDLPALGPHLFQRAIHTALAGSEFESLIADYEFRPHRDAYMLDVVGNTVCADLLDYAKRDSHFAGLRLDFDADRIAENFTLVSWPTPNRSSGGETTDPFAGRCLRAAISLVSHKYRTDVPSELMHLLNVRFYLYERVIYHPTKCSAGAMLGTALQMLGWRKREGREGRPSLPQHLRFVGDEVFLHDIRAAVGFLLTWLHARSEATPLTSADLDAVSNLDRVHNGLVPALMSQRLGESPAAVTREFEAAKLLLDRLNSRRFFRPLFRVLPSSRDPRSKAANSSGQADLLSTSSLVTTKALADLFRDPNIRYRAERQIEERAGLPAGSVAIHCPRSQTAEKIAAVLLTRPGRDVKACQLREIAALDPEVFSKHQEAVLAVEEMYKSMWRLVVYLAPEYLPLFERLSGIAGVVIFEVAAGKRPDLAEAMAWDNDPQLEKELKAKLGMPRGISVSDSLDLSPAAQVVGQLADELLDAGRIPDLPVISDSLEDLSTDTAARLRRDLERLWGPGGGVPAAGRRPATVTRGDWFTDFLRRPARLTRKQIAGTRSTYAERLELLSASDFEELLADLEGKMAITAALRERASGPPVQLGFDLNQLLDHVDTFLRRKGVDPPSTRHQDIYRDTYRHRRSSR